MDPEALLSELTVTPTRGISKVRYTHEAMIDQIVSNPCVTQNQLAAYFGRTPAWISTIMQSDAFKARLEQRREEVIDPELRATVKERFEAMVVRSLQVLQEKLSKSPEAIPDNLALRAMELGAKGLAIGGFAAQAPAPPSAPSRDLETLANRLIQLQGEVRRQASDAVIIQEVSR